VMYLACVESENTGAGALPVARAGRMRGRRARDLP